MVRGKEGVRIRLHPEITFIKTAFDHECFIMVTKASEELAADPKPRGPITRTFFDAWEGEEKSACDLRRYDCLFRHGRGNVLGPKRRRVPECAWLG